MPIPIIVWGGGLGAMALAGVIKSAVAAKKITKAKEKYNSQRQHYESFIVNFDNYHSIAKKQLNNLATIRLESTVVLGDVVKFLKNAKIKERDLSINFQITPQKLIEWQNASINAVHVLGGIVSAVASGASTAAGSYGLIGILASASTGTAISSLSGVAATNATLAWLGGGTLAAGGGGMAAGTIVLGGIVVAPALLVASFFFGAKASDVENQVEKAISDMNIDEANKRIALSKLEILVKRITELKDNTHKLKTELEKLLKNSDPELDEDAYLVAKTAKALGVLLEICLLDKNGNLMEKGC